ncbi:MAG: NDP-sugar synthase [Dehalococcoidia bacterium]|nr:NDP-sugar synthase [Dehalococcoidia bacterium]
MKAVLLVGGEGTRLRPLTCNTVKAMVPIVNRPFLQHLLGYLKSHGVDDIVVTLCYLPDRIENRFGNGSECGVKLAYVMEETPLGTAGAVKNAESHLDGAFFVFNGDIITNIDLQSMLSFHRKRNAVATIALTPVENPSAYGVVETASDGRVKRFIEKPPADQAPSNLINAGIYILEPTVLQGIPHGSHCMFERQLFPSLLSDGAAVFAYSTSDYWIDMGTPEKYRQVQYDLLQRKCASLLYTETAAANTVAAHGTVVHQSAVLEGPIVFGNNCSIGAGARIKGPTVLGDGCSVSDGSILDKAILWQNVRVGKEASVRESVIGDNCVVGRSSVIEPGSVVGDNVVITEGSHLQTGQRVWPDTTV